MDLELVGKRALVTGGNRGIGRAIAQELAREGADVAIAARDETALKETSEELKKNFGRKILPVVVDTGVEASVHAMVATVADAWGGIDILVNNAARAGGHQAKLADLTDEQLLEDLNVKVLGYLRSARAVAPLMIRSGWGRIINIGGLSARSTGSIAGSIRNVGVVALSKNLADELGPKGINVNVVHPGAIRYVHDLSNAESVAGNTEEASHENGMPSLRRTSIGRKIDPVEVAYAVTFLASPKSVAVNGEVIVCGGGQYGSIYF